MSDRTLTEVLALPPGPELDAEIAARVFGLEEPEVSYTTAWEGYAVLFERLFETGELRLERGEAIFRDYFAPYPPDSAGRWACFIRLALLASQAAQ